MKQWSQLHAPKDKGKLLGYARVSTAEQNMDAQFDALRRAGCNRVFHDEGVSGAQPERTGLDELLKTLSEGDTLVVHKLDRLGRSVQHLSDLIVQLDERGIQFCALSEGINTNTHGGRLVFHIFAAVAEFERGLIRERTLAGLAAAKQRGSKIGRPRSMSINQIEEARVYWKQEGRTLAETASRFGVSESTLQRSFRYLEDAPLEQTNAI